MIEVGNVVLQPGISGQQVMFFATGNELVDGLEFDIQVGDGGSDVGGTDVGPIITAIDLITGTPFEGNSPTQVDVVTFDRARQSTVDVPADVALSANTKVATVTFDTTGVATGSYDLLLSGVAGAFDTTYFDGGTEVTTVVVNGQITVVPEPSAILLLVLGLAMVWNNARQRSVGI
jgi:hypothetical protein